MHTGKLLQINANQQRLSNQIYEFKLIFKVLMYKNLVTCFALVLTLALITQRNFGFIHFIPRYLRERRLQIEFFFYFLVCVFSVRAELGAAGRAPLAS